MFLASTSVFVSCKDYDDDIKNLQTQIDTNKKTLDNINTLVTSGSVITNVERTTTGNGGIVITLSNGQKYEISNGATGATGAAGKDAVVWTIGTDGYWYQDGVKSDYKAKGEDGAKGETGAAGAAGANGKDGKYYVPGEDGFWYEVVDGVSTKTNVKWSTSNDGAVSVVFDEETGEVKIQGVEGFENGIVLAMNNAVRSLVFEGDGVNQKVRVYIDGVPGIRVASFNFKPLVASSKNSQAEKWNPTGTGVINPATYAYYHVNPSNANVEDLQAENALSYIVKKDADYLKTRANATADFDVKPEFVSFEDGVLKVKLNVTGKAATDEKISVAALQLKKGNDEVVTSDYACIYNYDMNALRFFNKTETVDGTATAHKYHYRRLAIDDVTDYDPAAYMPARLQTAKVWSTQDGTDFDIELKYNDVTGKDLNDYVGVHNFDAVAATPACLNDEADIKNLGLTVKYEVVNNYKIGTNLTDQKDFINLDGSVIKAKVFGTTGTAAIGRTPVIRASLMSGDKVVEVAYIKVKIVGEEVLVRPDYIDIDLGNIAFKCTPDVLKTNVETINVNLYNVLRQYGISREIFYTDYTIDAATLPAYTETVAGETVENLGTVTEIPDLSQTETTHLYEWRLTSAELWNNTAKEVCHVVKYTSASGSLSVRLIAHVGDYKKEYDINEVKYIGEYWNADKTIAYFNVNVPTSTSDANNANCLFENDPNSPFTTYATGTPNAGILEVEDNVTDIRYEFHPSNAGNHVFGGKTYNFNIQNDGNSEATILRVGTEVIATITNGATTTKGGNTIQHRVELNKASTTAKELLNTREFTINVMATGWVCGEQAKSVKITFKGQEYYTAQYRRPIEITQKSKESFTDGVDFGEAGSYVNIKSLIAPYDWRNREFGLRNGQQYFNYWGFYGPFTVTFTNTPATAQIKLNGEWKPIPATIVVEQAAGPFGGDTATEAQYGYITYKNNGTTLLQDTEMKIKVTVNYGWGTIETDWISVDVKKTI
jgi:hypothetical protein